MLYLLLRELSANSQPSPDDSVLGARGDNACLHISYRFWPCFSLATERVRDLLNELPPHSRRHLAQT